jgi:hypothetical protein
MLASYPKRLVVHNNTLKWDEYEEGYEVDLFWSDQLVQFSADSTLIVTCEVRESLDLKCTLKVWDSCTFQIIGGIESIIPNRI